MEYYELDTRAAMHIQITNDAFHYIVDGEQMLDEENMEEVNELKESWSHGFKLLKETAKPVENEDLVEVELIPSVKRECNDFDYCIDMFNNWQFRFSYTDRAKSEIYVCLYNKKKMTVDSFFAAHVSTNTFNHKYFMTTKGSRIFIDKAIKLE